MFAKRSPKGLENKFILNKYPDRAAKLLEYCLAKLVTTINSDQGVVELLKLVALRLLKAKLPSISGVKGNPVKNEAGVRVIWLLFGSG